MPNSIHQLLTSDTALTKLLNQIYQNKKLAEQIREILPSELALHVHEVLLKDDRLTLWTISPAWASRLRFFTPCISKAFPHIKTIHISILPHLQESPPILKPSPPLRIMSADNAQRLLTLSQQVSTPELQAVLIKLAAAHSSPTT